MKKPILIGSLWIYWPIYSLSSLPSKTWLSELINFPVYCGELNVVKHGLCCGRGSGVCRKWRQGVKESLARKESLSFSGWKMDDDSTTRLVHLAYSLKELDMYSSIS